MWIHAIGRKTVAAMSAVESASSNEFVDASITKFALQTLGQSPQAEPIIQTQLLFVTFWPAFQVSSTEELAFNLVTVPSTQNYGTFEEST
jgi:hypothetical protein